MTSSPVEFHAMARLWAIVVLEMHFLAKAVMGDIICLLLMMAAEAVLVVKIAVFVGEDV